MTACLSCGPKQIARFNEARVPGGGLTNYPTTCYCEVLTNKTSVLAFFVFVDTFIGDTGHLFCLLLDMMININTFNIKNREIAMYFLTESMYFLTDSKTFSISVLYYNNCYNITTT